MSTTTSGPRTLVVRRMMPSGCKDLGVPAGGVTHPFTQVGVAEPAVGVEVCGDRVPDRFRVTVGEQASEPPRFQHTRVRGEEAAGRVDVRHAHDRYQSTAPLTRS